MTPAEALRAAGDANDAEAVRALLADLTEAERAELVPVAREFVAAVSKEGLNAADRLAPMLLMAYGTLPVTEIRKLGWRSNHMPKQLAGVLRRRAPERLVPVVEFLLDEFGQWSWPTVRPLIRDGIVSRPDRPSYTIAMLAATRYRGANELLAEDAGLLEVEAWRLFEVEGGGEDSLANHEKFFGDSWGTLFRGLAAGDPPIRQRLLDASLAALARDFATYRAGWFSRFHESLAPTDDERAARADAYLGLLRSRVGPTVSLAVAALTRIDRAGRLPPDVLLEGIGPVLVEGSAGTTKAGLALVGRAGAGSPALARRASVVATDALAHTSPEIQGAAIALIGRLTTDADADVARAISARLPDVAASQRSAASALLARLGEDVAPADARPSAAPAPARAAAGRPSPIDPDRVIEPLSSAEALIDIAVSVLETGEPADDVERVLDAVGRLAADRSELFVSLTAAVARRARTVLARRESYPFSGYDPRADVAAVLLAWATGELAESRPLHRDVDAGAGLFLSARAREIGQAAAAGQTFESDAAPSHTGGWIDPDVLVRRLQAREPASRLDLVAALLRLSPDGREAALGSAARLTGEVGSVVR